MDCIKCSTQINEGDMFCGKCGKRINPLSGTRACSIDIYGSIMTIIYGIAVLTCFICNLAVAKNLSWFYIVLAAIAIAYSITNVPFMVKKHKLVISGICASTMLYVLLFICNWFVKGDWLVTVAYPLATLSLLYAWGILLVCSMRRMNRLLKSAFISLIAGIALITINPLCDYLLGGATRFYDYLSPTYWPVAIIGNKIAFVGCVCYSFMAFISAIRVKYSENV